MKTKDWYAQLKKPAWAPPAWLFGPVWSVLYLIIALNLMFNAAFTPLQFGLRSNALAAVDITLVLGTLIWALATIYPIAPWVLYANIPYLIWVCFATVLQYTITAQNR